MQSENSHTRINAMTSSFSTVPCRDKVRRVFIATTELNLVLVRVFEKELLHLYGNPVSRTSC